MNSLGFSVHLIKFINVPSSQMGAIKFYNLKFGQILCVDKTCFLRPGHI